MKFKYLVLGNHPIFKYVNRYCITKEEMENVVSGLKVVGYEIEIKELKETDGII